MRNTIIISTAYILLSCSKKSECVDCQISLISNGQSVTEGMDFCEDAFQSREDYLRQKNWHIDNGYTCTEQ